MAASALLLSAVDEDGKAVYGVPGPGRYGTGAGAMGRKATAVTLRRAPDVPFGVPREKLEKKHAGPGFEQDAHGKFGPGPMYKPDHHLTEPLEPRYYFAQAERSTEALRFVSKAHSMELAGVDMPGPDAHKRREGKGQAKTLGDAPTFVFGTGPMREPPYPLEVLHHPDARYDLPTSVGNTDASPYRHYATHTFAPHGKQSLGMQRSRDDGKKMWVSEVHNKTATVHDTPGPGAYDRRSTLGSARPEITDTANHARSKFGKPKTFPKAPFDAKQPFQGDRFADADVTVPGPEYVTENAASVRFDRAPDYSFGSSTRFYSPELGGAEAGPYISRLHGKEMEGSQSPGPEYTILGSVDEAAKRGNKFGKSKRSEPMTLEASLVPGPGAYEPKSRVQHPADAAYSIASNRRTNLERKDSELEPGPGTYEENREISNTKWVSAKTRGTFGRDGNRGSFMAAPPVPGLGHYVHEVEQKTGYHRPAHKVMRTVRSGRVAWLPGATAVVDAATNVVKPKLGRHFSFGAKHMPSKFISRSHSHVEGVGMDSPGPGNYHYAKSHPNMDVSSTHKRPDSIKFTRDKRGRDNVFISKLHSSSSAPADTPGPGSYKQQGLKGMSNKFKNGGSFSFGTSTRPSLATVRF